MVVFSCGVFRQNLGLYFQHCPSRTLGSSYSQCPEFSELGVYLAHPVNSCPRGQGLGILTRTPLLSSSGLPCTNTSGLAARRDSRTASWRRPLLAIRALFEARKALWQRENTSPQSRDRAGTKRVKSTSTTKATRGTNFGRTELVMMYIVSYTLRPKRDATKVLQALQESPRWWHYLDDTWIISTRETAPQLYERLRTSFSALDSILIAPVDPYKDYSGWLPKEAWNWIEEHKYL